MRTVIKMSFIIFIILSSVIFSTKAAPPGTPAEGVVKQGVPYAFFEIDPPTLNKGDKSFTLIVELNPNNSPLFNAFVFSFNHSANISLPTPKLEDNISLGSGISLVLSSTTGNNIRIDGGRLGADNQFQGNKDYVIANIKMQINDDSKDITLNWDESISQLAERSEDFTVSNGKLALLPRLKQQGEP